VILRIAHLSDIHFGGEDKAAVEAAVGAVSDFGPDLTVISGDLTLNGLPREFVAVRDWLGRLPPPQLITPGNHDTPYWNLVLRALNPFGRYRRFIGEDQVSRFDAPGLAARSLNSARGAQPRPNWSKGAISTRKLTTIDWGEAPEARLKLFTCHHPLIDIPGAPVTGGVHRGAAAAKMLADAGVELVLTGHVHNPFVLPLPGAEPGCYAVGAGTLSLRTRGTPAGFSTIVVDEARIEVTAFGWTGTQFETTQEWDLTRRPPAQPALASG